MSWFNAYPEPHETPAGNPIGHVDGDVEDVETRGTQLTELAAMMTNSASLIQRLVDHGADMEGDAIDRLRETAGQVGGDLALAARLYEIVAPHIVAYGAALSTAQADVNPRADALHELWAQYAARANESDDLAGAVGREPDDDADPDVVAAYDRRSEDADTAATNASAALTAWREEAARYDTDWNTWHDAFESAAGGITEETTNAISDTPEDDWRGFLAAASEFLMWAGIVLAVLAVVIGGPIIAAIALAVSIASLVVVCLQMPYGDADGWDLALAIVGVIPFGAVAEGVTAFRGGAGTVGTQLLEGGGSFARNLFDVAPASGNSRLLSDFATAFSDDGARWLQGLRSGPDFLQTMNMFGPQLTGADDFLVRLFTGSDADFLDIVDDIGDLGDAITVWGAAGGNLISTADTLTGPFRD